MDKEVLKKSVESIRMPNDMEERIIKNLRQAAGQAGSGTRAGRPLRSFSAAMAAVLVFMALSVTAFAVGRFALTDLSGPKKNTVSTTAIQGTKQYEAAAEWEGYVNDWYDKGENEPGIDMVPDEYTYYHAFSREAKDRLDELLEKYELKMHGMPSYVKSLEELYSAQGSSGFMPAMGDMGGYKVSGTLFSDGSFSFNGSAAMDRGSTMYQFYAFNKDYFSRGTYMLADRLEAPEEWNYTTAAGVEVLLVLGEYKSVLAADMEDCFVFINILSGRTNKASGNDGADASRAMPVLDKARLEAFADSFDFGAINALSARE